MTAPERPEGLPEAFRRDEAGAWVASLEGFDVWLYDSDDDGANYEAGIDGVLGCVHGDDAPGVLASLARSAKVVARRSELKAERLRKLVRALLGEEPAEAELAGHTPGPWEEEYGDVFSIDNGAQVATTIRGPDGGGAQMSGEEESANARLIAAAPTLLRRAVDAERELAEARAEVEREKSLCREWQDRAEKAEAAVNVLRDAVKSAPWGTRERVDPPEFVSLTIDATTANALLAAAQAVRS